MKLYIVTSGQAQVTYVTSSFDEAVTVAQEEEHSYLYETDAQLSLYNWEWIAYERS